MASHFSTAVTLALALFSNADCAKSQYMAADIVGDIQNSKSLDDHADVDLRVTLLPRDEHLLDVSIAAGYVMTPAEYQEHHAPTQEAVAKVIDWLASFGMAATHQGGHVIAVQGTAGQAKRAFASELQSFRNAAGNVMRAKTAAPVWPSHLHPAFVTGLSTRPKKVTHHKPVGKKHKKISHAFAAHDQSALDAGTIRSAYNIPSSAIGKNHFVAMVELDGYDPHDLDVYAESMNIRRVPTTNILLDGADGSIQDQGARGEVTLDIELAMAMAPGLAGIVVYEAPNGDHAINDILSRIANPKSGELLLHSISCSWGEPESYMTKRQAQAEGIILKQLAAQGQSVFVAAGDSGATDDGSRLGTDDPASQPYAIAVGGTNLSVRDGAWVAERTWADGGGGISQFWASPSWQKGIEGKQTYASLVQRDVPDVALNADPNSGYAVYVDGWQVVGGTSCAAPLWAAFMSIANEQRAIVNKPLLPYFGPVIYAIGASPAYRQAMHDVADRSTNGFYPAVVGLDAATGWGSINGAPLLNALVAR